jgi:hypothetical protein
MFDHSEFDFGFLGAVNFRPQALVGLATMLDQHSSMLSIVLL